MSDTFLHYTRQGIGPPLLLLHGNGEDSSYFVNQMDAFSFLYTVYAIDTRGHGQSPRGDAPFTMEQFAQDLLEFMDARRMKKANILGFSDGGNIALTFALAHPERVDRLILNGANLQPSGVKFQVQAPIVLGYWAASLFAKFSPKAKQKAEILGLMVKEPHIPAEALKKLCMPTLIIVGTRDMIRDEHTLLIASSLPQGRMEMIVGDHFIAAKNPDEFNQAVAAFLADTRSD